MAINRAGEPRTSHLTNATHVPYNDLLQDGIQDMVRRTANKFKAKPVAPISQSDPVYETSGLGGKKGGDVSRSTSFEKAPSQSFLGDFINVHGQVDVDRVAIAFHMSKGQLAETVGLSFATVSKAERRDTPKAQRRVTEMLEIIARVRQWAGGAAQAMAWYRSQPIAALNGRTPEALVKDGQANAVREYLDHIALGGFA